MHLTLAWSGLYHCQAVYEANGCCCHVNGIKFISKLLYISGSETVVCDPKWGHGVDNNFQHSESVDYFIPTQTSLATEGLLRVVLGAFTHLILSVKILIKSYRN